MRESFHGDKTLFKTQRLTLREVEYSDLDFLHALDNDPEVMRYINGGAPASRTFIEANTLPLFTTYDEARPGIGFWIVTSHDDPTPMGWVCLRDTEAKTASLGFRFAKQHWGQGYATEAATALIDHGFQHLGLSTITATTYEENIASRRTLEKLGFTLNRYFRENLSQLDTAHVDSADQWPGMDIEYLFRGERNNDQAT